MKIDHKWERVELFPAKSVKKLKMKCSVCGATGTKDIEGLYGVIPDKGVGGYCKIDGKTTTVEPQPKTKPKKEGWTFK